MSERAVQINVTAPPNSGKTALMGYLVERFSGFGLRVARVKYPVYSPDEHGAIDYCDTGRRINDYLRKGNPEKWDSRTAQAYFAANRFFFDIQIRKWLAEKEVILSEDGRVTSIIWGCLTDQSISRKELEDMNRSIIEPNIRFILRGPRLGGIEAGHIFEDSGWWEECQQVHLSLAEQEGWGIIDYDMVEGEENIRKETARVGDEIIRRSAHLFLPDIQRRL